MAKLTYANKVALNPQPSIADINKCTADDMNEIKSVVNTNYGEVGDIANLNTTDKSSVVNAINEIKGGEIFSTTEIDTGKKWIDGKPIYRKVINIGSIKNTTSNNIVNPNISNLDTLISLDGIFNVGPNRIPINFHNSVTASGSYSFCCFFQTSDNLLYILCKSAINSGYVVMEYTKTTD